MLPIHKLSNDMLPDTLNKDNLKCTNPGSSAEAAVCNSQPLAPGSVYYNRALAALDRIEQSGGECANIAREGRRLLANQDIGWFPSGRTWSNGHITEQWPGGYGAPNMGAALEENWFKNNTKKNSKGFNLDSALVHEIEHVMRRDHDRTDDDGWEYTPHDLACTS